MIENEKRKRKYGNQINYYINLHLEDGLGMEFTPCKGQLMPCQREH